MKKIEMRRQVKDYRKEMNIATLTIDSTKENLCLCLSKSNSFYNVMTAQIQLFRTHKP